MPHLTLQISPIGPILNVLVGVSAPREQAIIAAGQTPPSPVHASLLVDTGASGTAIDPTVLAKLNLVPTGVMTVHTPTTTANAPALLNQYDISLHIPTNTLTRSFHALPVGECSIVHQGFDGLLGRDVLSECLLIYTGPDNAIILSI